MARQTFNYGRLRVTVRDDGESAAPWDKDESPRFHYKVSVKGPGNASFSTDAWGSINDYEKGNFDYRGMAWTVISDLVSAKADPDEFIGLIIGESSGREALDRGKIAEKIIKKADKFAWEDLEAANTQAQEEGA